MTVELTLGLLVERQGVVQTVCVMTTTAVLVRLLLMLLNGGALIR